MLSTDLSVLLPLLAVCAPALCALWVLRDARAHESVGHPVGVYFRTFQLDKPETWAMACLLVWIFAFPLYLKARIES